MSGWDELLQGLQRAIELILSGDPEVARITVLSLRVSGTAVLLGSMVGIPLGALIALKPFPGKSLVRWIVNTLMGLPPVVVGLVFYLLLSSSGPMGFLRLLWTPEAMIIAQLVMVLPISMGLTTSAVAGVNPEIRERALSLGASSWQQTLTVLREARFGILTSIVASFGAAISEVGAVMMVGGNLLGFTRVLTTGIVLLTNQGKFDEALALGIILLGLAFLINGILTALQTLSKRRV